MTGLHKLPPRLAKPLIYTIRDRAFDFRGVCEVGRWGGGAGGGFFFSSRFSSDRKPEIFFFFFHSLSTKIFFSGQSKNKIFFFSKQHICSKCIFSDLYVRVYLEPNIHGYMYMGILFICSFWVRGCM